MGEMQAWRVEASQPFGVRWTPGRLELDWEDSDGWAEREAPPGPCFERQIPALGASLQEWRWTTPDGPVWLRAYFDRPVASLGCASGIEVVCPGGWSAREPTAAPWEWGSGRAGTQEEDLAGLERLVWPAGLREPCPARSIRPGETMPEPGWLALLVDGFRSAVGSAVQGIWAPDRDWLRVCSPDLERLGEGGIATWRVAAMRATGLAPALALPPVEGSAADLADLLLYLHQTHGIALFAPPDSGEVWLEALERVHFDAQGEVGAVWIAPVAGGPRARARRLGPQVRMDG